MDGVIALFCIVVAFSPVVVIAAVDLARQRARMQAYEAAIASDPTNWLAVVTGAPAQPRPTGPIVFHAAVQWGWRTSNSIVAFDDEFFVVRRLDGDQRHLVADHSWPPPRYSAGGLVQPRLAFGTTRFTENATLITEWLAYFGWPVSHPPPFTTPGGSRPAWTIPTHIALGLQAQQQQPGRIPVSRHHLAYGARPPAGTPDPRPPLTRPAHDEVEFGTEDLGPAIDDWLNAEDFNDIE